MTLKWKRDTVRGRFSAGYGATWCLLLCVLCWMVPAAADASKVRTIREKLDSLENKLRVFLRSYRNVQVSESNVSLQRRLADGQLNYLLKDYVRASIILFDAVEKPGNQGKRGWYDAVYYLAESLYQSRNFETASKHFRRLVRSGGRYAQRSLIRLMEIAEKTKRYKWVNSYFSRASAMPSGPLRDKIYYLRAKGLYSQKQYSSADRIFRGVGPGKEWPRAQYFLAVIQLQTRPHKESIPAAIQILQRAVKNVKGKSTRRKKLRDIIHISLARLFLERKKIGQALNNYQRIDRKSQFFDQALYEICWAYIRKAEKHKKDVDKKKEYKRALRALDLLLAFLPDSPFYPRAQLLRSHLLLRLSKFNGAMKNYQKVVKRYSAVSTEMETHLQAWKAQTNPREVFERMIEKNLDKFDVAAMLPKDAVRWMENEQLMKRTLTMLRDLRQMNKYLVDSRVIIKKLESVLTQRDRTGLTPTLREGRLRAISIRSELIQHQEELNQLERDVVLPNASPEQKRRYQRLQERLRSMQTLFRQTPQNRKDVLKQNQQLTARIDNMKARLHKLSLELNYTSDTLKAARNWLTSPAALQKAPAVRKEVSGEINALRKLVRDLNQQREQLGRDLELAQVRLGNAAVDKQEENVQQQYRNLLAEESQLLRQIRSGLSNSQQRSLDEIRAELKRIRGLRGELRKFFKLLSNLASGYSRLMQKRLRVEKMKIQQYAQEVDTLRGKAKRLASGIAYGTFLEVRQKFRNLILRADVGVIDVVWQEKQSTQTKIRKLSKERNSELRVLDSEFRDILQEVK